MFKTTYLDSWGSGVKRMVDACTEAKVPRPRYELRPGGVVIVFDRPNRAVSGKDAIENVPGNVPKNIISNVSERQRLIIRRLIETGTADVTVNVTENASTLAKKFAVTERTIKRDLTALQSLGIIRHDGPDKGGKWIVLLGGNN